MKFDKKPSMNSKMPNIFSKSIEVEEINENEIPQHWRLVKFQEIIELKHGHQFRNYDFVETGIPVVKIGQCKEDGTLDLSNCDFIDINRINEFLEFSINKGDLLMALTGGTIGKVTFVDKDYGTLVQNYRVGKFVPNEDCCSKEFASLILKSSYFQNLVKDNVNQSAQPNIGKEQINNFLLPLPPLSEQVRIVTCVEALLSHVNAAHERLSRVPLIMKKFRQAVLAAACSGRLTEGWREENPRVEPATILLEKISLKREKKKIDHLKKVEPLTDELSDLPENWIWTQIGFITESMKNGVYKTPNFYKDDGFPCLRMYNIEDGKIIWKNIKHMDLTDDEIKTYLLKQNDILINRVNSRELVGKSALITEKIEPCVYESKNIRLRMYDEEIYSQYVVYWLQVNAQKYFNLNAQQTVGMASINQDQIASMPIPLPPLAEQHEIVRRVGLLFERADAFDQEVAAAGRRCERLTQAVLGKAFRGELR